MTTPIVGSVAEDVTDGLSCLIANIPSNAATDEYSGVSVGGLKIAISSAGGGTTDLGQLGQVEFSRSQAYMFRQDAGDEAVIHDLAFSDGWFRFCGVQIDAHWVSRQVEASGHDPLIDWAYESLEESFFKTFRPTPAFWRIAEELRCCPYSGLSRRLFLESRILELILLCSGTADDDRRNSRQRLDSRDISKLEAAREEILRDLSQSLTISNLSSLVGLNVMKLKSGFKQRFGQSIRQFIIDRKLEEAEALLSDTDLHVAQIAYRIGYTPAHFSYLYRKRFGYTPSERRRRHPT